MSWWGGEEYEAQEKNQQASASVLAGREPFSLKAKWQDSGCCSPGGTQVKRGSLFLNEGGQTGQSVSMSNAVMKILVDIDSELGGSPHQSLKGIPCPDAFSGTCLQAHISLANTLPGSQLRWIIV